MHRSGAAWPRCPPTQLHRAALQKLWVMADVLGGGGDGPEPAAKRAKVSVAGLPAEAAEFLRTETLHLAAASGVLLGADGPFAHAPLSLLPYPFPSSLFSQATALAAPFNLLVDRISRDLDWLCGQVRPQPPQHCRHTALLRHRLSAGQAAFRDTK